MGFGFLGGFRVNLHRGADVLVTHDVLNDLQVGLIFAQPGAERVPEIMAGERRQQLRFPLFLFGLFQLGFVVGHTDALDGAVDRLRVLRLAEAVQEYEVRDSVDLIFAHQFQLLLVGAFLLQCFPHFGQDRNCPLACGSLGCGHGEIAAAHLVVMVHQIVLDGNKPTLEVDVAPAQANRFRDAASGTQHEGKHREPVLELRRFLDEIQKRLLLGQGQSVSFGRFVLVGGFNGRQDTIRGIHTDVLIVHRHRKDLMKNILDGFQRVQRHLAIADDAIVVAADIRLANVLELHHADLIPDEPIVHINVIGEGMLFQAHLVLTPQFKQVIQGQAALRNAEAICQVVLDLLFLFAQPLQGCIIDGMAFSVFRSPTVHIQPIALAVDLAILQNTAFIIFTSLHINSPFHSQNVEKEPYAMSIP